MLGEESLDFGEVLRLTGSAVAVGGLASLGERIGPPAGLDFGAP